MFSDYPETSAVVVKWKDNDPLSTAEVYLDEDFLGNYDVRQLQGYNFVTIGKDEHISMEGLENRLLKVVAKGEDDQQAEIEVKLTKNQ